MYVYQKTEALRIFQVKFDETLFFDRKNRIWSISDQLEKNG